eukprot:GEMP01058346.1.p1 GENE.GEMP01058346.1~~GEMP01058346.1.p1  ORF type:complete len:122 (-),score=17.94 GEMP01058346.1:233-598(-)
MLVSGIGGFCTGMQRLFVDPGRAKVSPSYLTSDAAPTCFRNALIPSSDSRACSKNRILRRSRKATHPRVLLRAPQHGEREKRQNHINTARDPKKQRRAGDTLAQTPSSPPRFVLERSSPRA